MPAATDSSQCSCPNCLPARAAWRTTNPGISPIFRHRLQRVLVLALLQQDFLKLLDVVLAHVTRRSPVLLAQKRRRSGSYAGLASVEHGLRGRTGDVADADVLPGHQEVLDVPGVEAPKRHGEQRHRNQLPVAEAEVVFVARVVQAEVAAAQGRGIGEDLARANVVLGQDVVAHQASGFAARRNMSNPFQFQVGVLLGVHPLRRGERPVDRTEEVIPDLLGVLERIEPLAVLPEVRQPAFVVVVARDLASEVGVVLRHRCGPRHIWE